MGAGSGEVERLSAFSIQRVIPETSAYPSPGTSVPGFHMPPLRGRRSVGIVRMVLVTIVRDGFSGLSSHALGVPVHGIGAFR